MKIFEINAPLFHGFYNTIWEPDTEQEESELLHGQELEFDYQEYQKSIGEGYCDAIKELLDEYISKIRFLKIESPREYNFTNDKINCVVQMSKTNLDSLKQFIYSNEGEFKEYIKAECSSRPGFFSFVSNDFNEWESLTKEFTEFEDVRHLQIILEFILSYEVSEQQEIYDMVHHSDTHRAYQFCSIKEDDTKYVHKCIITGHGMSKGFVVNGGDTISNDEKLLVAWLRENIYTDNNMNDDDLIELSYKEENHYYTEWEDLDETYFNARGEEFDTPLDEDDPAEKITVSQAKEVLRREGYLTDIIWSKEDITNQAKELNVELTDEQVDEIASKLEKYFDAKNVLNLIAIESAILNELSKERYS